VSGFSMLNSVGASLSSLGVPRAASLALEYAADAFSWERGAGSSSDPAGIEDLFASARPAAAPEIYGTLPDGFVPIREARNLALLGRWPLLEDGMPPCLPLKLLLTMMHRCEHGDANAEVWMKLYHRAFSGETAAQLAFGKVCETGTFRAPADLQRAFFWYYRAALEGDAEARHSAERVARATTISPAAMAEPTLAYPGMWRITAEMPGGARSSSLFELAGNGAACGCLLGSHGDSGSGTAHHAPAAFVGPCAMFLLSPQGRKGQYQGQWAYHPPRRILTFDFAASVAEIPGVRGDAWQIELIACRMGALFGRDRRMVSYALEYEGAPANGTPAGRRP
jgi:TPR repeat protein